MIDEIKCVYCGQTFSRETESFQIVGKNIGICRSCRNKKKRLTEKMHIARKRYQNKRDDCKKQNIPFDLCVLDFLIPQTCPILGITLNPQLHHPPLDDNPSLDRINPLLGYVKTNVIWISNKANRIKSNATWEEISKVARFYKKIGTTSVIQNNGIKQDSIPIYTEDSLLNCSNWKDSYMSLTEFRTLCGFKKTTYYKWRTAKKLPMERRMPSGSKCFLKKDVYEWIENQGIAIATEQ